MPSHKFLVLLPDLPVPNAEQDESELIQIAAEERFVRLFSGLGGSWTQLKHADCGAASTEAGLMYQLLLEQPVGDPRSGRWWLSASVTSAPRKGAVGIYFAILLVGTFGGIFLSHDVWHLGAWSIPAAMVLSFLAGMGASELYTSFPVRGRVRPAFTEFERKVTAALGPGLGIVEAPKP